MENRFKVLQKFTSNKLGYEQEFVYRIYIQYYGGDWADIKNWDYGQLTIENTSTGAQEFYFGEMKKKEKEPKDNSIEAAGLIFFVVEQTDDMVRLRNINKFEKDKLKPVIEELKVKYPTIIFTTTMDRDNDYLSYINGVVEDENGKVVPFEKW